MHLKERADEEITLLEKEMVNVAISMKKKHSQLVSSLASSNSLLLKLKYGRDSLIVSKLICIERHFSAFRNSCGIYASIEPLSDTYIDQLIFKPIEADDIGFSKDDLNDILNEVLNQDAENDFIESEEEDEDIND